MMPPSTATSTQVVVTGFGPFGDHDVNPSWEAAGAAADRLGTDAHLLPVNFQTAAQFAGAHLRLPGSRPVLFLHFGLGTSRDQVCFERRATNQRGNTPDERERRGDVDLPEHQPLIADNRDQRFSRLDFQRLVDDYNHGCSTDLPAARISEDCGTYVCNALLYHSLRACRSAPSKGHTKGQPAEALFVHIPKLDTDDARRVGARVGDLFTPPPTL